MKFFISLNGKTEIRYDTITDFNTAPEGLTFFDSTEEIKNAPTGVKSGFLIKTQTAIGIYYCGFEIILSGNNKLYHRVRWYSNYTSWE